MPADDFTIQPTWMTPDGPVYSVIVTESENFRKEYTSLSTAPVEVWKCEFNLLKTADRNTIRNHYKARLGGFDVFAMTNIPTYMTGTSSTSMTGRWVNKSYSEKLVDQKAGWNIEIEFEKSNT